MTRRIAFLAFAGIMGTDSIEVEEVPDDTTNEELSRSAWEFALSNADSFGVYPASDYEPEDDDEEMGDEYSENIEGWWEPYDPAKHLQLKPGGGKWFDDDPDD